MKISELVARLQALQAEHGDIEVKTYDDYAMDWVPIGEPEVKRESKSSPKTLRF